MFLGKDGVCTNKKHCIYSTNYNCIECEDEYVWDNYQGIIINEDKKIKNKLFI